MDYAIIALTVLFGAVLTFFSGFGLGTLMLPVFSLFFPLPIAIGATAIVHLSNNLFKFGLVYKHIHKVTLLSFGFPAVLASLLGAITLRYLADLPVAGSYLIGESTIELSYLKIVIGSLMIFFSLIELIPKLLPLGSIKKNIVLGGLLSGFFGGISGHQGAFRSAFLSKAELTKEEFIATSNSIALLIDLFRLIVYYETFNFSALAYQTDLLVVGIVCAFIGTYFGKKLLNKVTMSGIQKVVAYCLLLLGALFIAGLV